jgi:signal transduction histidine kinase/CheY-like chemotaxis protein/ligand-binding sensor domain-containing protein
MKKNILYYIITLFVLNNSNVFAINLPVNSSDKSTISNWIISKENNIEDNQLKNILNNTQSYFQNIPEDRISELHLSNFNDVTISLYQLFDDIDFKSTFVAACIIETKNEQVSGFVYDDFDLDVKIYINGEKVMSEISADESEFEYKLKNGKNTVIVIGKAIGRYNSTFNLRVLDEKLGQLNVKVLDQQGKAIPLAGILIKDNKISKYFTQNKNGENKYWVQPGIYQVAGFSNDHYKWANDIKINKYDKKDIKLILTEQSKIYGTIYTMDQKTAHPGVSIQLINANSENVFITVNSDAAGKFDFRPPPGVYQIRIFANNNYQYHKTDGKNTEIKFNRTNNINKEINFTISNQIKGSWMGISMFDGMLSNGAHVSLVSSEDLLYLGTYNGLSIYDGLRVKSYNYDQGLPNGFIAEIYEDIDGYIWIGYGLEGLVKWKDGEVLKHFTMANGLPSDGINAIDQDKDGNLLIGTTNGLSIFNGEKFTNYNFTHGLGNGNVNDIKTVGNNIWVGCGYRAKTGGDWTIGGGLSIFNGKTFKSFDLTTLQNLDPKVSGIRVIERDESGNMWIGTHGGLLRYDGSKFHIYRTSDGLAANNVSDILIDENGVWVCTSNGLMLVKDDGMKVVTPFEGNIGLGYQSIQSISKSNDGIYFIGTGNGVFLYDPNSFRTISSHEGIPTPSNWTRGILDIALDRDGFLWAASGSNGVYKLNNEIIIENFNKTNSELPSNYTAQMEFADDGSIWFAHFDGGISRYSNGEIENMTNRLKIPSNTSVSDIAFDTEGTIWLSTSRGLGMYKNDSLTIFDESDGLIRPLRGGDVNVGNNNEIIYSTYGSGFSVYNGKSFTNYDENNGLADNRIWDLAIDSKNNYWLALDGSGVQMFDGETFTHHKISDGVTAGETFTAYVDDFDNVWIGTFGGGVCYYDGNIWNSVDTRDGLLDDLVGSIFGVDGNKYWFGSEAGITSYVPKRQTPTVYIEQVETPEGTFDSLDELFKKKHSLRQNSRITFTLNSNSFNTKKEKQKYIVNVIKDGVKESRLIKTNEFEFFPVKTGDYEIEFQSIDRDLNYSKTENIVLSIVGPWYINPPTAIPFWGFILFIFSISGYTTKKYIKQRQFNIHLKEEGQRKDREARERLEEKNSELLESQKAAEAANAAKSTFLANMSHELRTPLNAIIGYSEMLMEDAEDENEDFIPDLDKINNSGKHLLGLINDILDLSKVESGKMELYIEEFDLSKIMSEIESTIKPLVQKNNNALTIEIDSNLKTMTADITKIRQIMLNLLSNSSKFTNDGSITIHVSNSVSMDNAVDFIIADTGIGMSAEQVDKVFKPFTQADEKTTRKFGGTGLGLTITKMFAEMMDGKIKLTSQEGKGTSFTVTIPKVVFDKKKQSTEIITDAVDNNDYTILVIDDDDNAQDMMKKFLEKQDLSILQAKTGEDGLKLAAEHMPDVITLDVMMPEMDGWEVLAALQGNERTKNIPVIMLTMADEPDIGYSLGATDYLTKPVNWTELSTILNNHQIQSDSQSILIVEDDEITREMLRKSLEKNDFKVRSAVNGKEALEKVSETKPGLIILDLMMPEMDGFEFAERLRENKEWLDIPVVVITAKDLTKEDHSRLKGNVEAIMQKGSYSKNDLLSEVGERIKKLQVRS